MILEKPIGLIKVSEELLIHWKPIFIQLRKDPLKEVSDAAFCGIVAFIGIHLCLWPQWIKIWEEALSADQRTFDIIKEIESDRPWICLNLAYGKNTLLSHVQTEGVDLNREHIRIFLTKTLSHMFRSLDENGQMIVYDHAVNALDQMGYTEYQTLAISIGMVDSTQLKKKQLPSTKKIPIVPLSLLEGQWETWIALTKKAQEILLAFSRSYSQEEWLKLDVKNSYSQLAAYLWNKLVEAEVIDPFGEKRTGLSRLRKPRQDVYRGNILIYGDHESFWQKYKQEFLSEMVR